MGGHDLDTLEGNISLCFAEGWEPFTPLGEGRPSFRERRAGLSDDREILTRNWVWRQCDKDKATEKDEEYFYPD